MDNKAFIIKKIISDYYDIPIESINAGNRKYMFKNARMLWTYFMRTELKYGVERCSYIVGYKNHASTIYANEYVSNNSFSSRFFVKELDELRGIVKHNLRIFTGEEAILIAEYPDCKMYSHPFNGLLK